MSIFFKLSSFLEDFIIKIPINKIAEGNYPGFLAEFDFRGKFFLYHIVMWHKK